MKSNIATKLILLGIFFLAAVFRLNAINWDQGFHLHPDERAIILAVVQLQFPQQLSSLVTPESTMNPHFFAYGSLPFYLLYWLGQIVKITDYDNITYLGRIVSAASDLLTLLLVFLIGRKLFGNRVGLIAAALYAISVLPMQLSHFFAVDTLLTFFTLATLYQLLHLYEKPSPKRAILVGIFFGLALATKISALVLLISIGTALAADFLLIVFKQPHKPRQWFPHVPSFLKQLIRYSISIFLVTLLTFFIIEPYAFIDFSDFWSQTQQQSAMTKDAFTFPYTFQYVGKIPYLYELRNIFFFGLGPLLATFAFAGTLLFAFIALSKKKYTKWAQEMIILVFFLAYFITVGKFAVGFMRYMLPLYPLFCLFAAILIYKILQRLKNKFFITFCSLVFGLILFIWPLSFLQIYTKHNPRVDATNWILEQIPAGDTLAVEHWDDRLPITMSQRYSFEELALYESDTEQKWQIINQQLAKTDYLVIASNRLYTPLQKLTNCAILPSGRCYTRTAKYYHELFAGVRGFKKVAEFTDYPTIPFLNISINDNHADESFTVYDHPKVMIFQKIKK